MVAILGHRMKIKIDIGATAEIAPLRNPLDGKLDGKVECATLVEKGRFRPLSMPKA